MKCTGNVVSNVTSKKSTTNSDDMSEIPTPVSLKHLLKSSVILEGTSLSISAVNK